jgi:hypothetical protein
MVGEIRRSLQCVSLDTLLSNKHDMVAFQSVSETLEITYPCETAQNLNHDINHLLPQCSKSFHGMVVWIRCV